MGRSLMKGNEALALAAMKAGCSHFFGYPITPQNEIPEYLARELPKSGGVFLQAESETAAIHMVYGAAASGGRAMTTSSSPGIALMQEGISMIAAAELPCVIVNVQRGGPGPGPSWDRHLLSSSSWSYSPEKENHRYLTAVPTRIRSEDSRSSHGISCRSPDIC